MVVIFTCENGENLIKNVGARVLTRFSPIITRWEVSVAMETKSLILRVLAIKTNADKV